MPSIPVEVGDKFLIVAFGGDPILKNGSVRWETQVEIPPGALTNFYDRGMRFRVRDGMIEVGNPLFDFVFTTFVEVPEPST